MASQGPRPLDGAFVVSLRNSLSSSAQLSAEALYHWQGLLNHFQGRSNFEIAAYIAQNFNSQVWTGSEPWFTDRVIQGVFNGYDRTAFNVTNEPELNDEARSHYNPSNTLGRGTLFPALPAMNAGPPILNRQQFDALSPAQRRNYQLTSMYGGHRFQRVPDASTSSGGDTPGVSANTPSGTVIPPFDNTVVADPPDINAGNQAQNQNSPAATNIFGVPTPPSSNQPGSINVPPIGQLGGPAWVAQDPGYPALPGSNTGVKSPHINYPDISGTRNDLLPSNTGPPNNLPVTPGTATGTGGSTSGTAGDTSATAGTTPGTAGSKLSGGVPPGGPPGGVFPPLPAGTGFQPITPVGVAGTAAPPSGGLGVPPAPPSGGLGVPPAPPSGGIGAPPGVIFRPPLAGTGFQPVTPVGVAGTPGPPSGGLGAPPGGGNAPPAGTGFQPVTPAADGSVPRPLQPSASDMLHNFTWRGQAQPPVGSRLRAAQILLDEGDIDREMHWERNVAEVHEFLNWLLWSDESPEIGPESTLLAQQLLHKIQAHNLFNETHYGPNIPNKVITADMIPAPKPRLKYNGKLPLVLGRDHNDQNHLLPWEFPTHPRAEMIVNDQWLTDVERRAGLTEEVRSRRQADLSQDEEEWWRLGQDQQPAEGNAALSLESTFEECIAKDGVGYNGWIETRLGDDGVSLTRTLFNGDKLGHGKTCYARERAVRRAGLQAALRQFNSNENQVANTPWRRVRLPLSADEVELMRKNTGAGPARKYELPKLKPHQLERTDGKDDPQGFTANMAKFWADQTRDMATAREVVVSRLGFGLPSASVAGQQYMIPPPVLPPMSLWGAYVDSGLDADNEYDRQMLREMRTTKKLFDRELKIAPRNLLKDMNALYQKGLGGEDAWFIPEGGQERRIPRSVQPRDMTNEGPRDLDKMEIYWIRFLLTQSITPEMTQELEPRASLFILFADKLAGIFNDVSDPLFPDNATKVSIEDLLDYIHDRADGPVQRVKFYAHDVQMWLERLHSQGRCRYQEDWRCYGWVMRPISTCHPEQLIRWTVTGDDQMAGLPPNARDEDVVFAPRFDRLRNWHSLVRRGLQNSPLDERVEDYFYCLAYRWGYHMAKLTTYEGGLEQRWRTQAPRHSNEMARAIMDYKAEFDRITQWNDPLNNPLVKLVKTTLTDKANDNTLTAEASLQLIRDHIIKEAVKSDSMLWPARSANNYLDPLDEKVRPKVWGWARPEVRGKVKRFFSVNRWPVQLQTERRQGIITRDEAINEDLLWRPELEDPTPSKYYRPKARPYIDEKVEFKAGHRNFLIGDTPRQKQVVIDRMFAQMGRAITAGADKNSNANQDKNWAGIVERWQTWSDYLWDRFIDNNDDDDEDRYEEPGSRLRKFDRKEIPTSQDPRKAEKRAADDDAAGHGNPKRPRQSGPEVQTDGARGSPVNQQPPPVIPGVAPANGVAVPVAAVPGAAAPGAADAGAAGAGAASQGDQGTDWWQLLYSAGAI